MTTSGTFLRPDWIRVPHWCHFMDLDAPKLSFVGEAAPVDDEAQVFSTGTVEVIRHSQKLAHHHALTIEANLLSIKGFMT